MSQVYCCPAEAQADSLAEILTGGVRGYLRAHRPADENTRDFRVKLLGVIDDVDQAWADSKRGRLVGDARIAAARAAASGVGVVADPPPQAVRRGPLVLVPKPAGEAS